MICATAHCGRVCTLANVHCDRCREEINANPISFDDLAYRIMAGLCAIFLAGSFVGFLLGGE